MGKCVGVWGRCVEKYVGVWGSVGGSVGKWRKYGERRGGVGRGEGKCMRVNVKSVAKCVRVWTEV